MTKELTAILLVLALVFAACCASAEQMGKRPLLACDSDGLLQDLLSLNQALDTADRETEELNEALAYDIAAEWERVYLDPDYPVYCSGTDNPEELPVRGKHAFVILGFELKNGEMTPELKGRCDAAAEAAGAFPGSVIVCSGGATGKNNPDGHTEAGLMKQYLSEICGIDPDRIFTDEKAMTTADNAINTFRILREQGIDAITIVTSSYHQRRAHMLYYALADWYSRTDGWTVQLIGNYSFEAEGDTALALMDAMIASSQIREILQRLYSA